MIERISELDWASFEKQLIQKCPEYYYGERETQNTSVPWTKLDNRTPADVIYGIQQQIIYNASALLDEVDITPTMAQKSRYDTKEIWFWNDCVLTPSEAESGAAYDMEKIGYENNKGGREASRGDDVFKNNNSFKDPRAEGDEDEKNLYNVPRTHAARSYIEISEWAKGSPEAKLSDYVSRKVSLLWFFNVVKAIVDLKYIFRRLICGTKTHSESCIHIEAEKSYDKIGEYIEYGSHAYDTSDDPAKNGSIKVYGNAQFNGEVSTFHSEARFHKHVKIWDQLHVFGNSYFSKDINGTAMRVRWADVAEYYRSDASYTPGTLVQFGGRQEITIAGDVANAVVTTNPGLILNEDHNNSHYVHPVAIALVGKVPVKVYGTCRKFDLLIADEEHPGYARVKMKDDTQEAIARALEDGLDLDDNLVLCATNFRL